MCIVNRILVKTQKARYPHVTGEGLDASGSLSVTHSGHLGVDRRDLNSGLPGACGGPHGPFPTSCRWTC